MSRQLDEYKVYSDTKLKLKYDILNKLGEGCFGTIFKAISKAKSRQIALKLQFHDVFEDSKARSNLSNEIAILERLKGLKGIPKLYGAGKWGYGYYMEIELLTSSLHDEKTKMYSELQIWNITSELIQILQSIHNRGIVHQDLKPQNIMKDGKGALYIIDYGLSSLFNYDVHEKSKKTGFVGTPRYASLAAHEGYKQKPKDDLQSLLYVMGAIHLKKAPWFELKGPPSKKLQRIQKYKEANSMGWFKQCGQPFAVAYEYLTDLAYDNEVNYEYMIGLFQSARRSMALQTVKITRPQLQGMKNFRHNSEKVSSIRKSPIKPPQITINLVEQPKPIRSIKKRNTLSTKLDQDESEEQNNFSQVAQDGYMELLQILTEKLLGNEDNLGEEEDAVVNSICGREPRINNIAKYEVLLFKNPFTIA